MPNAANDTMALVPSTMLASSIRAEVSDIKRALLNGKFRDAFDGAERIVKLADEVERHGEAGR